MKDTIIIIESPNKVEKIANITGAKVYATKGHFKSLTNDFLQNYEDYNPNYDFSSQTSSKSINYMVNECKNKEVIIATDPDREGYAIGFMFYELIKNLARSIKRAEFFEITESGIKKGLDNAIAFANTNFKEFESYKARAVGDKLVGYILSPKYINKLNDKNISIGRVQTPALAFIVEKELDIKAFNDNKENAKLSYKIRAKLKKDNLEFKALNNSLYESKEEANKAVEELKTHFKEALVYDIIKKQSEIKPDEPFRTSQLQEEANKKLDFSPEYTMSLAQKIFEKGLITYMRTDSNALSNEFLNEVEDVFKDNENYEKREYKAGKQSQAEAHEAIRITHAHKESEIKEIANKESLSDDELSLYKLIWQNSIASQAKNAINENISYDFAISSYSFKTKTTKPIYKGFKELLLFKNEENENKEEEQDIELNLNKDESVEILDYELVEVKKQAPSRYKSSNFISLLEKEGIGRPSTYASFLPKLLQREYVELKGKKGEIYATKKGIEILLKVKELDEWISSAEYTRQMENVLDLISKGQSSYLEFIKALHEKMEFAKINNNISTPPSEKSLEYAMKIAEKLKLDLPPQIQVDYKICKDFIDKYKDEFAKLNVYKPSDKQIALAKKLANDKKLELPKDYEINAKICSDFITKAFEKKN